MERSCGVPLLPTFGACPTCWRGAPIRFHGRVPHFLLQKRLAIGIVAALGLGAFGLIPTEQLRLKPDRPMYFYIVPLLRIRVSGGWLTRHGGRQL